MRIANLIVGLVVGAAVGAGIAMMFAPAAGKKTKENVLQAAEHAKERAKHLQEKGRSYIESERVHIAQAVAAGRQAAREKRAELERELQTGAPA
jgi:gas vesicle protein